MTTLTLPSQSVPRIAGSGVLAASITFGLFALMDALTRNDNVPFVETEPYTPVDMVFKEDEPTLETKKSLPPIQKAIERPKEQPPLLNEDPEDGISSIGQKYAPEKPVISNNGFGNAMDNTPSQPILRMSPKYPAKAAQAGIEGWVRLIFSINAAGQVKNVEVIESEPKRIFDNEAKKALKKWKYRPRIVDGKPVPQDGQEIVLEFKLERG